MDRLLIDNDEPLELLEKYALQAEAQGFVQRAGPHTWRLAFGVDLETLEVALAAIIGNETE